MICLTINMLADQIYSTHTLGLSNSFNKKRHINLTSSLLGDGYKLPLLFVLFCKILPNICPLLKVGFVQDISPYIVCQTYCALVHSNHIFVKPPSTNLCTLYKNNQLQHCDSTCQLARHNIILLRAALTFLSQEFTNNPINTTKLIN